MFGLRFNGHTLHLYTFCLYCNLFTFIFFQNNMLYFSAKQMYVRSIWLSFCYYINWCLFPIGVGLGSNHRPSPGRILLQTSFALSVFINLVIRRFFIQPVWHDCIVTLDRLLIATDLSEDLHQQGDCWVTILIADEIKHKYNPTILFIQNR